MLTLPLIFSGSPNPNNFGLVSETICDQANHLLSKSKWDRNKYVSPIQDKVPPIESLTGNLPFSKSLPMIVDVPTPLKFHAELYIDDFMIAVVDIDGNATRSNKSVPLEIHTMGIPLIYEEPTPKKEQPKQSRVKRNETKPRLEYKY